MPHTVSGGFRTYFETHGDGFPLLLINGPGGDHREWLYQIPDARLVVLPGAPHRLFAENADAFNKEVLEFLRS